MDPEKEKMLSLLKTHSQTIVPSFRRNTETYTSIGSLPNTLISPCASKPQSCPSSCLSVHSCHYSTHSVTSLAKSSNNVNLFKENYVPLPAVEKVWQSDSDLFNCCRICQVSGDSDNLVSPCKCSGSLKYVHYSCLLKWIEYSSRRTRGEPMCELCHFVYKRHKRFRLRKWKLPNVSKKDKCLHTIFFFTLILMITCAVATVLCFLSDHGQVADNKSQLSTEEVITLTCGVLFFISFFAAMTVEIKARHTVYRLFRKFIVRNTEWQIEPYSKS
ncbi:E3 ubiquitin-protein ligase MARCHF2-like isoform X2 [Biomphalaria glabrata]|nr:E3 ubiquitin-protein ligase MARCHF2-like isoform X2 [Biomphalaria glabrata]XP_055886987.1 E3 ubiquitin-protein ligase MARCHF2-like isoform X2 [Biomphalaria glabrata]XP_055886988.1 E3 ubiquitin-protein ligase MARCHF2-like isoform X2 [Biomphalaria glabrata]XP_055886989.1 E3 ubiquitin-protein ligase MARCHF2-like isoform X2 [Biomphalaria glabrata]XP_055886990.1 E3 ubiquitin-protein ligase MARCHF2-like isoform X2 [Biomphalaria glabrata]KAI8750163.1 E3 ubiquitin-protein ligase MARCH1-like [Biomph